ncbi:flagellar hook protein FlgE [Desulfopila inferna]|uniref:flagellar hook protein FlgE n=1 Tax=Desulfopila inferna TaxID=468528 RepID=UPI0019629214|nr:flagellar hook protein FlgE [Desulfopila inferna]MBM9602977.1 flagellar hook protein FlgE [Desulfopila inferna]
MGISSALYSGVSGLNTNSQAMTVIGNNLANTNTLGFKGARTIFSDLLSSTINGSGGTSQVGRGVNVSKVDNIFSQGTFESTESGLDVAIEGDGFFLVSEVGNDTNYYTRAGAFRFDENGFLVNPEGFRVQGKRFDVDGNLVAGDPEDIRIGNTGLIAGNMTTEMTLNTNLDAAAIAPVGDFDYTNADTFNYSSSTQIFDSLGEPHLVTTYFTKDAVDNTWNWNWSAEDVDGNPMGSDLTAGGAEPPAGIITFANDGTMLAGGGPNNIGPIDWGNGSDAGQAVDITFDTTQFNSASTVISQVQNGFAAGNLTSVDIDGKGAVIASYSNGEQIAVANLVLGKFNNPNGLELVGNNLFTASDASGVARVGLPGPELGKVFTNSLEQSNVDMGAEFVRMITVQRGFQANSKIITTVDELLGELINLKR